MVCSIIDECRCFAYDDVDSKRIQFCGMRRGPNVVPCPEKECCAGGCPGQVPGLEPREPFRIIERPSGSSEISQMDPKFYILVILVILSVYFYISYLKIN